MPWFVELALVNVTVPLPVVSSTFTASFAFAEMFLASAITPIEPLELASTSVFVTTLEVPLILTPLSPERVIDLLAPKFVPESEITFP